MTSPKKTDYCKVEETGNCRTKTKRIAMKKTKYAEAQIIFAIKQSETGAKVEATFYIRKKR